MSKAESNEETKARLEFNAANAMPPHRPDWLTMRDWFAMAALIGEFPDQKLRPEEDVADACDRAYVWADSMIEARKK